VGAGFQKGIKFLEFNNFSFHPSVAEGVRRAGYISPTPIQHKAIPEVMKGLDVMGLAQTGTGKTAAFVLPILNRLVDSPRDRVGALIVVPTRELADQIHETIRILGGRTRIRSAVVYGGVGINPQIRALKTADIVVACPGRLLDHIERRTVDLSRLKVLVLDEADQMFDMGFLPSIRRILNHIPRKNRQTLLFSATMPEDIRVLAKDILKNPETVRIGTVAPAKTVRHALFPVAQHLKTALLLKLLACASGGSVLVFTRTKHRARSLGQKLSKAGYRSTSLQGNLSQARRQTALSGFRTGEIQILVATDIAARGIDVSNISHVINYDIPTTTEAYIHRIGRTGRAECSGEAFTLVTDEDTRMVSAIEKTVGGSIEKRTLADFDYEAPSAKPEKRANNHERRPGCTAGKRKSNARRRTGEGAFAWFSARKAADVPAFGNHSQTSAEKC